jgi:hypothetical protein
MKETSAQICFKGCQPGTAVWQQVCPYKRCLLLLCKVRLHRGKKQCCCHQACLPLSLGARRRIAHAKAGTATTGGKVGGGAGGPGAGSASRPATRTWAQYLGISRAKPGAAPGGAAGGGGGGGGGGGAASSSPAPPQISATDWAKLEELLTQQVQRACASVCVVCVYVCVHCMSLGYLRRTAGIGLDQVDCALAYHSH